MLCEQLHRVDAAALARWTPARRIASYLWAAVVDVVDPRPTCVDSSIGAAGESQAGPS